jgi:hypothetical protein
VSINAQGVMEPAAVFFIVEGVEYPTRVTEVVPDEDLGGVGRIIIETLPISGILDEDDLDTAFPADVRVEVGSMGGGDYQTVTAPGAFTFTVEGTAPDQGDQVPEIYSVVPSHGSARGGEMVTILGQLRLRAQRQQSSSQF